MPANVDNLVARVRGNVGEMPLASAEALRVACEMSATREGATPELRELVADLGQYSMQVEG